MVSHYEQLVVGASSVYRSDPEAIVSYEDGLAKVYILDLPASEKGLLDELHPQIDVPTRDQPEIIQNTRIRGMKRIFLRIVANSVNVVLTARLKNSILNFMAMVKVVANAAA